MHEMLLLNIGNTHTLMSRLTKDGLTPPERLPTAGFVAAGTQCGLLTVFPELLIFATCVVPDAGAMLRLKWPGRTIRFLEPAMLKELDLTPVDCRTVGTDRIANLAAALEFTTPPFIVLDCGTAITTVAVDAGRRFRGGAILPGRALWRRALHEHTAQLPEIEMSRELPVALGVNTVAAIRAGVDLGVVGAVKLLLERTREELDAPTCSLLATGGDNAYFLAQLPELVAAPPDFILRGLARVATQLHL